MIVREDAEARARGVRLLLLDGDGVLSDGSIFVGPSGEEWKSFDSRDGLGIRIAQRAGISFGIVTGRRSRALEWRANELRILELQEWRNDLRGGVSAQATASGRWPAVEMQARVEASRFSGAGMSFESATLRLDGADARAPRNCPIPCECDTRRRIRTANRRPSGDGSRSRCGRRWDRG